MKILSNALLALALISASTSASAWNMKRCDNCTNPKAAASTAPLGEVLVVDNPNHMLWAYESWLEAGQKFVVRSAVPADAQAAFDLQQIKSKQIAYTVFFDNRTKNTQPGNISFPAGYEGFRAADLLINGTARSQFLTIVAQLARPQSGTAQTIWSFVESILAGNFGYNGEFYTFVFSDGSKLKVQINNANADKGVILTAEDAQGNPIPIPGLPNGGVAGGSYVFNGVNNINDFMDAAYLAGITISVQGGLGYSATCSANASGGLTCVIRKN